MAHDHHFAFSVLLAACGVHLFRSEIVIRPSDSLLSGTDYHLYSAEGGGRRAADFLPKPRPAPVSSGLIHAIDRPSDVPIDPLYENDFWEEVADLPRVPPFSINEYAAPQSPRSAPQQRDLLLAWNRLVGSFSLQERITPLIVDVGAELGYFSLAAAALGAHVIAFEPYSRHARKFSKSIRRNRFERRITLFQNAVSGEEGLLNLTAGGGRAGSITLPSSAEAAAALGVYGVDYVGATSLSYVVREDVDLLRINVGGSDEEEGWEIISGARRLICNFSVKYIFFIADSLLLLSLSAPVEGQKNAERTAKFLESAGYVVADAAATPPPVPELENSPPSPPMQGSSSSILFELRGGGRARC